MAVLPQRDRIYLGLVCLAAVLLCAGIGFWLLTPWAYLGCLLFLVLFLGNDYYWKIPVFPCDRILSAHSPDGLNWSRESGVRLNAGGLHASLQVYYPVVVKMQAQWRMFYRAGGNDSSIASAVSCDGLAWREEEGWRLAVGAGFERLEPYCALAAEQGWYLYYNGFDGQAWSIYRAHSLDGLSWVSQGECRGLSPIGTSAKDACVLSVGKEKHIFFSRKIAGGTAFFTGESSDGMHWRDVRRCCGYGIDGYDLGTSPRVIAENDGEWRMFYSEWADESFVGMRIASARSSDGVCWRRETDICLEPGGRYDPYGVFCPEIVECETGWRMYYGGFWERHLLELWTLYQRRDLGRRRAETEHLTETGE